jgi:hypothetical protein
MHDADRARNAYKWDLENRWRFDAMDPSVDKAPHLGKNPWRDSDDDGPGPWNRLANPTVGNKPGYGPKAQTHFGPVDEPSNHGQRLDLGGSGERGARGLQPAQRSGAPSRDPLSAKKHGVPVPGVHNASTVTPNDGASLPARYRSGVNPNKAAQIAEADKALTEAWKAGPAPMAPIGKSGQRL